MSAYEILSQSPRGIDTTIYREISPGPAVRRERERERERKGEKERDASSFETIDIAFFLALGN